MVFGSRRPQLSSPAVYRSASGWVILAAAFVLAGCAGGGVGGSRPAGPPPAAAPSVPASPTAPPSGVPSLTPVPQASASAGATSCVSVNLDYAPDARGKAGDIVDLARAAIAGLQAGDVVERDVPTDVGSGVQILRDGEVIGTVVDFPDQHGGWLLFSGVLCGGLGFKS